MYYQMMLNPFGTSVSENSSSVINIPVIEGAANGSFSVCPVKS